MRSLSDTTTWPVFTWKGNDYQCVFKLVDQELLEAGGQKLQGYLVIEPLQAMDPIPNVKDRITFEDKDWIIEIIERNFGKPPKLTCFDPARGS